MAPGTTEDTKESSDEEEEDEEHDDMPEMSFTKTVVDRSRHQRVMGFAESEIDMTKFARGISKASNGSVEDAEDSELLSHKVDKKLGDTERAFLMDSLKKSRICGLFGDDSLEMIVNSMQCLKFKSDEPVMKEDVAVGNHFFIADDGSLESSVNGKGNKTLQRGACFGEIALAYGTKRTMTVFAKDVSHVWAGDGAIFRKAVTCEAKKRHKDNLEFVGNHILFDGLPQWRKDKVGQLDIVTETFEKGDVVMAEGSAPFAIYFVKSGEINLKSGGEFVESLPKGSALGWRAVLYGETQLYTTEVESKAELLALSVPQLKEVLGKDISKFLMQSFLLSVIKLHPALSRLHALHQQKIAQNMKMESYPLKKKLTMDYPFGIIVDGEVAGTRGGKPVTLGRGEYTEDSSFMTLSLGSPERKESRPSESSKSEKGEKDEKDEKGELDRTLVDAVSAHRRCKVAVLSRQNLQTALREAGSLISQDMVTPRGLDPHSRAMDYLQHVLMIRRVSLFDDLSCEQIDALVTALELKSYLKDTKVVTEGEVGEAFFIIQTGQVKIEVAGKHIRDLGVRASFGERALIFGEPRSATATVTSEKATVWCIHRDTFKKCVTQSMRENLALSIQLKDTTVTLKMLKHKRLIGAGSFGSVRLVEHKKTGLRYALKRIRKKDGKVPEEVQSECQILSEVKHPFVLTLVCTLETDTSIYIVTELLTGGQLHEQVQEKMGCLSRKHAQFYIGSMVLILEALHSTNIVFRDLKPDNIMLDNQGYLKLVDFGLAKKLNPKEPKTFTACGTMLYMAPEVLNGDGYGCECDIWSLGIVFFELVCGMYPFGDEADSVEEIMSDVLMKPLEIPSRYNDNAGKKLILGLLAKESDKRLGTGVNGWEEIKDQRWFKQGIQGSLFNQITGRELKAPLVPEGEKYSNERDLVEGGATLSDAEELGEDEALDFGCRLLSAFSKFDLDGDGKINREELGMILERIDADTFTSEVVDELMTSIDIDKDGNICYDEFVAWIVNSDAKELRKALHATKIDEID